MKKRAIIIFTVLLLGLIASVCIRGGEAPFYQWNNGNTWVFTNQVINTNFTSNITQTNVIDTSRSIYHTFLTTFTGNGTNSMTNIFQRTIDGSTWITVVTNGLTTNNNIGTTNIEATYTGFWTQWRVITIDTGTNSTHIITYGGHQGP